MFNFIKQLWLTDDSFRIGMVFGVIMWAMGAAFGLALGAI